MAQAKPPVPPTPPVPPVPAGTTPTTGAPRKRYVPTVKKAASGPAVPLPPDPVEEARKLKEKNESDKNPALASSLSLVVWGAGQFYNRQKSKGIFYLLCYAGWILLLLGFIKPSVFSILPMDPEGPMAMQRGIAIVLLVFFGIFIWLFNIAQAYHASEDIRFKYHGLYQGAGLPMISAFLSFFVWGWGQLWNARLAESIFLNFLMFFWWMGLFIINSLPFVWRWGRVYYQSQAVEALYIFFWVFSILGFYIWYQSVKRAFLQAYYRKKIPELMAKMKAEQERIQAERTKLRAEMEAEAKAHAAPEEEADMSTAPKATAAGPAEPPKENLIKKYLPRLIPKMPRFRFKVGGLVKTAAFFFVVWYAYIAVSHIDREALALKIDRKVQQFDAIGFKSLPIALQDLSLYLNPNSIPARENLAHLDLELGYFSEAYKEFSQLYMLEPTNLHYRFQRNWTMYYKGNYEEAKRDFLKMIQTKGLLNEEQILESLRGLGESRAASGDFKGARDAYYTIVTRKPSANDLQRLEQLRQVELDRLNNKKAILPPLQQDGLPVSSDE